MPFTSSSIEIPGTRRDTALTNSTWLRLGVALTVRFRSAYGEEQNVEIANRGHDKRVVNALAPTRLALHHGRVISAIDDVPSFADQPWNDSATHLSLIHI